MRLFLGFCALLLLASCRTPSAVGTPPLSSFASEGYFTTPDGVRLFFRAIGSGPDTVVVLHGSPGYHMNYLLPDLVPLARGRTLLFYDQRGGGRSELVQDTERLTIEHSIQDLEALRRHFGLERLNLLGHSWGGGLAALYALKHPTRVERMLLLAPMTPRRDPYFERAAEVFLPRLDDTTWTRLLALDQSLATAADPVTACRTLMAELMTAPLYFADASGAARFQGDFCDAPPEALRNVSTVREAINRSRAAWDYRHALRELQVPTLVVHGERDAIPTEASQEWVSSLPDARLLIVWNADHYLFAEKQEEVIAAADEFFRGSWPAGSSRLPSQAIP